ncbi:MAG: type II toxin-antitoxin system RelE/ParE family toxin [Thermodesulfobacteriota bacterium]
MPQVIFTPGALRDLKRLREFLQAKNPAAAMRAAEAIIKAVQLLRHHPQIGRPAEDLEPEHRELLIEFGDSGYIALYHFAGDRVTVITLRHQKEAGY